MNIHLTDKKCVACEGGIPPLMEAEILTFKPQVPAWNITRTASGLFRSDEIGTTDARASEQVVGGIVESIPQSISRKFTFKDFKEALAFVDKVGTLAEEEGHHPDINLFGFKNVLITLSTHAIGGLSENDFIVAAKIDLL